MKAAILEQINAPLVVGDVELTDLLFGQVLVKIIVSGICGSQLQEIAGHKGNGDYVPHLLGHEGCGIIEDTGHGVTKVKKGDKVIMHWRKGNGIESDFPIYIYKGKKIRSGKVTTLSEYSIVSENRVTPIPEDTPEHLCALLGCGLSTALGTINDEATVRFGESVMIVGTGGLGINLIVAATLASAYPIISIDINDNKKVLAETLGTHLYINCKKENIKEAIQTKLGISDVDVIIDTAANKQTSEETIELLSNTGRYILIGQPRPGESIELHNANHFFHGEGKVLRATQGGKFSPSEDIPRYVKLHQAGILNIDGIITHNMKLDDINKAIDLVRDGQASRVLIEM
ncbi:MAG: hypothetical protein A3G52_02310 [Candidatus Taylorbacteria bacterium RIFCSPLOWO2_12_FULL_43_20]|uniref:Enoyl reductase (ER) domain-containing protein n=1 Tax=Candidatus Taylorbacteria bacterium RIFCSPLOWO2_12_FULL_43_20 TaxID=1802332 RepID=A0A1G2P3L4_9BACT|nr:MAG: hypothetical protein A3E92_02705 [Candidatus Taylorbacteria bacterium RIFCSPHIGHO2_12_FULL_42_34]OHA42926.1 MAG: hypothetical protein A3G52_02310 [Candidatus Taylorbacteria bacterium RIFCSPLOWO2_12_FULL_43_20]